jgi:hypothetical protein
LPARISLSGFYCRFFDNGNLKLDSIDLKANIEENLKFVVGLLDRIYEKTYKTLYEPNTEKLAEYAEKLEERRTIRDGGQVIHGAGGSKIILHTIAEVS